MLLKQIFDVSISRYPASSFLSFVCFVQCVFSARSATLAPRGPPAAVTHQITLGPEIFLGTASTTAAILGSVAVNYTEEVLSSGNTTATDVSFEDPPSADQRSQTKNPPESLITQTQIKPNYLNQQSPAIQRLPDSPSNDLKVTSNDQGERTMGLSALEQVEPLLNKVAPGITDDNHISIGDPGRQLQPGVPNDSQCNQSSPAVEAMSEVGNDKNYSGVIHTAMNNASASITDQTRESVNETIVNATNDSMCPCPCTDGSGDSNENLETNDG